MLQSYKCHAICIPVLFLFYRFCCQVPVNRHQPFLRMQFYLYHIIGVEFRLALDSLSSRVHGIIEARVKGIWGRVCLHNFNDNDASVACRHFGFDGGVAYLHIMKNDRPVLVRDVQCIGKSYRSSHRHQNKNSDDCNSKN